MCIFWPRIINFRNVYFGYQTKFFSCYIRERPLRRCHCDTNRSFEDHPNVRKFAQSVNLSHAQDKRKISPLLGQGMKMKKKISVSTRRSLLHPNWKQVCIPVYYYEIAPVPKWPTSRCVKKERLWFSKHTLSRHIHKKLSNQGWLDNFFFRS